MYTAIELAKKLCSENQGKVFLGKELDPNKVVIYCNRPDRIKFPKEENCWCFLKGNLINMENYETIEVLPKFYLDEN